MFEHLFTTYQQTDPPPIITEEYKKVKDDYYNYILPLIYSDTQQEENTSFSDLYYKYNPLEIETEPPGISSTINDTYKSDLQKAVDTARQFVGTKYSWGGLTPSTGFDDSGLIKYAYDQIGIELPKTIKQMAKVGVEVPSLKDVQLGDLVYSDNSSGEHVEMVSKIDNGQIYTVKAKGKKQGIVEQPLDDKKVKSIKRVVPSNDDKQSLNDKKAKPSKKVTSSNDSEFIINYFVNKGLTRIQAKGIYGNLMQESGGNIQAISSDGHDSYGLAQWTGPRKQKLFEMYGPNPTIEQQLDFLWWELNNTHKDALRALKQAKTVYDATKIFMDKFERPHKDYANFNRRLKYANSLA